MTPGRKRQRNCWMPPLLSLWCCAGLCAGAWRGVSLLLRQVPEPANVAQALTTKRDDCSGAATLLPASSRHERHSQRLQAFACRPSFPPAPRRLTHARLLHLAPPPSSLPLRSFLLAAAASRGCRGVCVWARRLSSRVVLLVWSSRVVACRQEQSPTPLKRPRDDTSPASTPAMVPMVHACSPVEIAQSPTPPPLGPLLRSCCCGFVCWLCVLVALCGAVLPRLYACRCQAF